MATPTVAETSPIPRAVTPVRRAPKSAFLIFCQATRSQLPRGLSASEVLERQSEMWSALSAEERSKYGDMQAQDMERFKTEELPSVQSKARLREAARAARVVEKLAAAVRSHTHSTRAKSHSHPFTPTHTLSRTCSLVAFSLCAASQVGCGHAGPPRAQVGVPHLLPGHALTAAQRSQRV